MEPMNSTKKCSGAMNISKNKLNSKISWLFNFYQTHTLYATSLQSHAYAWIYLNIYNKMHNIIHIYIYNLNTIDNHFYILLTL